MSVMPIRTWEIMGFTREDLIPTILRLAAANRGAIYVAGKNTNNGSPHERTGSLDEHPGGREFGRR